METKINYMELKKYYDLIIEKLIGWVEKIVAMLPNFALAILVLIGFVLVGKLIRNLFSKLLMKALNNQSLSKLLSKILYVTIVVIGAFAALSLLNLDKTVTSLLAGAGIVG